MMQRTIPDTFAAEFSGTLLTPDDPGYEEARRVHNGIVDKRPAFIARCRNAADVAEAVRFGRAAGLEISVRGGGHNVAGRAVTEGGVMIDLAEMRGIHVDPDARTVRAEGGVTWSELNDAAATHGLATTGGVVSSTGVAGLTLGGGLGWLMSVHGLAVDNLVSVDVVTASGELLTASEAQQPDLFWALRGGGGNFGVAVSFEFRLHELPSVYGGLVAHPLSAAGDLLRFYREFTASVPDELTVFAALVHAPDGSGVPLAAFAVCHAGEPERCADDLRALLEFGSPVMTQLERMPYPAINAMLDGGFPKGALNYWKSSFVQGMDDELIDTIVDRFTSSPSAMTQVVFEHFHGAATRIPVGQTAVPHREPGYNCLIASVWTESAASDENIEWTRATYAAIKPQLRSRRYLGYLDDDDLADAIEAAYGPNYPRLAAIKRTYDPDNIFHLNHNVPPSG